MNRETLESKFEEIAANGYTVGAIFQTTYVHDGRSRTDAWSVHLNDGKGGVLKGWGRNIGDYRKRLEQSGVSPAGKLNPQWVAWLMGFPPEWDACAPTEMPSSRKSPRNLSKLRLTLADIL